MAMPAKKTSLTILPDSAPLRGVTPFLAPLEWPPAGAEDMPRALRGLAQIVDGGLCHRCGSCIGICPTGVLATDREGFPMVQNLAACTDCDLCVKVCPGDEFDVRHFVREQYGEDADLTSTHGVFLDAFLGYAKIDDLRERSTSGGVVTALLVHLLESKQIDGAVVIAADPEVLWRGKPVVARTKEELFAAAKSKYAISPTNEVFREIRTLPGRYALVGLPCQIHGFIKAAELDARIRERVVLTIGLFCHAAVEHEGYEIIWNSLGDRVKGAQKFVSRIGKHPGGPHLVYSDGSMSPVYFGDKERGYRPSSIEMINILYRLYSPPRCLTCFDASSEFADIAVGDPWMAPPEDDIDFYDGWSFVLARSARGVEACRSVVEAGRAELRHVTRREALACNRMMATEKRYRAFRIIETHRRQGKSVPAYGEFGTEMPHQSGIQFLKTEINMLTHAPCFMPRYRAAILKFILSEWGYRLLWLNNLRRRFRVWARDELAKFSRRVFGRR